MSIDITFYNSILLNIRTHYYLVLNLLVLHDIISKDATRCW